MLVKVLKRVEIVNINLNPYYLLWFKNCNIRPPVLMGQFVIFPWYAFEKKWVGHTDLMMKQITTTAPQIVANSFDYNFIYFFFHWTNDVLKMWFYKNTMLNYISLRVTKMSSVRFVLYDTMKYRYSLPNLKFCWN